MKTKILTGVTALALACAMALPVFAGGGGGGAGGGGGGGGRGGRGAGGAGGGGRGAGGGAGGFDPATLMQTRIDNMKTQLAPASDAEWTVMSDKIKKVLTLQGYLNTGRNAFGGGGRAGRGGGAGGAGGGGGGAGGGGGGRAGAAPDPNNKVQGPYTDLSTLVANAQAPTDELNAKMKALRDARKSVQTDLTAAQDDLKKICAVRQEAVLVSLGVLE